MNCLARKRKRPITLCTPFDTNCGASVFRMQHENGIDRIRREYQSSRRTVGTASEVIPSRPFLYDRAVNLFSSGRNPLIRVRHA